MNWKDNKFIVFLREARRELRKVAWPSRKQIIQHTITVIVVSLLLSGVFGVLDLAFSYGVEKLL